MRAGNKINYILEPVGWKNTAILVFYLGTLIVIFMCLLRSISHWSKWNICFNDGCKIGLLQCKPEYFKICFCSPFLIILCLDVQKDWKSLDGIDDLLIYRMEVSAWSLMWRVSSGMGNGSTINCKSGRDHCVLEAGEK